MKARATSPVRALAIAGIFVVSFTVLAFIAPAWLRWEIENHRATQLEFPVTVDPKNKLIVENTEVNLLFESEDSPFQAAAGTLGSTFYAVLEWFAAGVGALPIYQELAATDARIVRITPGMRKEQVAAAFADALDWQAGDKERFLAATPLSPLTLSEGSFAPGVYLLTLGTTPEEAKRAVAERFYEDVLSRYGTASALVPLEQALTVASLIEREAAGPEDMREVSGIIWKRLFSNMKLQIDATVQYAKANRPISQSWWPSVSPRDLAIESPYNTYKNRGLPPGPIANPSVASIFAALNPVNTSCIFYFHDSLGKFHCSETYAGHVALLKKYYGRGK